MTQITTRGFAVLVIAQLSKHLPVSIIIYLFTYSVVSTPQYHSLYFHILYLLPHSTFQLNYREMYLTTTAHRTMSNTIATGILNPFDIFDIVWSRQQLHPQLSFSAKGTF